MVAFLVLLYSVYLLALVVFGILLRDRRAARATRRSGVTVVPAAIAGVVIVDRAA